MQIARIFAGAFGLIALTFGIVALVNGLNYADKAEQLALGEDRAAAEILNKYTESSDGRGPAGARSTSSNQRYYVRYEFALFDGQKIVVVEQSSSNFYEVIEPGQIYEVTYALDDPTIATLYGGFDGTADAYSSVAQWALAIAAGLFLFALWPWVRRLLGR
ncbi:MAG: DUF3592 domain-containing protein [Pseudomonadota bacterium]